MSPQKESPIRDGVPSIKSAFDEKRLRAKSGKSFGSASMKQRGQHPPQWVKKASADQTQENVSP